MTYDQQNQQPPATPIPMSTGQTIGHLAASFTATLMVAMVQFGVPLSPDQQSAILSLIVTGWAFGSAIYAFWHRSRTVALATATQTTATSSPAANSGEPS